ncbi:GAF domain-containing protein [Pendulispora albinea]|uniref:histidine kinase n=1 Tax=Pendulispora albinea TaxID=2741071 RepID=A0ABZ2LYM3_9BACT
MSVKSLVSATRGPRPAEARVAELEEALAREVRVTNALREVGLALGTTHDLDQVLELILEKITDALDADRATLYLLDEAKDELISRIVIGDEVRSIRLKVGQGIAGHVARTGKPLHVRDAYKDPRFSPEWDTLSGYRTRSILAGPMKNHLGRTIGVIQVLNKRRGDFSTDDAALLAALATQAAVSIDNSRLFLATIQKNMQLIETKEQLERRVRDLKLLFSLESAMARAASLEELFFAVLGEAMRSCEARAAGVALRDPVSGEIVFNLVDDKHTRLRRVSLAEGHGLVGTVMRKNDVVLVRADQNGKSEKGERTEKGEKAEKRGAKSAAGKTAPPVDEKLGFACHSALGVPLEGEEGVPMGAVVLYNKRHEKHFTDEDRGLLALITANASTAIQLQLAREAREREERLTTIGRLMSGMIHDVKTPLTVIRGYLQMMQKEDRAELRDGYAEQALKQFEHLSSMTRDVLEFARGERTVLIRKVYLKPFFDAVKAELEPEFQRRGLELAIELNDKGTARFDEGKLLRVIHNLARNAEEAMTDKGGRFLIKVTREKSADAAIVMTFSDTGPGIPKEIEHRLFESFVTSGKKGGTGLGLAIVKKITEEHGGTITVHSTNRGATFKLRLPQK